VVARDQGGRWLKGAASPNPSGLARDVAPLVAEARRLALSFAPKAIATLAALLDDQDPRVRVAAAEGLLDRAGLRPFALEPERLEVTAVPVDVDSLRAQLAARLGALIQAAAPALPAAEADIPGALSPAESPADVGSVQVPANTSESTSYTRNGR
jgi:hypothetical protein